MLTKLTEDEEKRYLDILTAPQYDWDWVHPRLVPWTFDGEGTVDEDILPLYKDIIDEQTFCFFADRQSVQEGGTILVDPIRAHACLFQGGNGVDLEAGREKWGLD